MAGPGSTPSVAGPKLQLDSNDRPAELAGGTTLPPTPAPGDESSERPAERVAPEPVPSSRPSPPPDDDDDDFEHDDARGLAIFKGWALLPRTLPYLRPFWRSAVSSVLFTILLAAVSLAQPWPLAFIIDTVLGGESNEKKPAPGWVTSLVGSSSTALILFAVFLSLLLTLAVGALSVGNDYVMTHVDQRMALNFRSDLFQHVQRLSLSFHDSARTGRLMYRMNNSSAVGTVVVSLLPLLESLLTLAGMLYIVFRIDSQLALMSLAVVPFIYLTTLHYGNRIEPELARVRGLEGRSLNIAHETMAMMRVVMAFGREHYEYQRFRDLGEESVDARVRLTVRQTAFKLVVGLITAVGTALVLGFGAIKVLDGQITTGELLVVLAYVAAVYAPLEMLSSSMAQFQEDFFRLRSSFSLLDAKSEVTESAEAKAVERVDGAIEFRDVSFSYPKSRGTLHNISFTVPPQTSLAIVGPTGAGKSTAVSLLPRFYELTGGHIIIGGHDIRDLTIDSLRSQFSIVLQEPLLFAGTIVDNIRYGRLDASPEAVEAAARQANAHDFITRLRHGYGTALGERGAKISGGERQRIAIARAFLRDAPILILDEPTSSIDSKTEGVILEALSRLMEGRTTVMIAHRLATIRAADQIIVIDRGRTVQRGTHPELVAQPGLYRQLWKAQTGASRDSRSATSSSDLPAAAPSEKVLPS
jgi:ATP-binding cassette, subfamily B, bacterial